ncbi:MAG: hypothetical protein HWN68_02680 [Desulfobacterales bacterium]|nr:hypothetical protein [Desulfobacterales bacterium]
MDRIVILTGRPEPDNHLVELLNMLFAGCKISTVSTGAETIEDAPADPTSGRAL